MSPIELRVIREACVRKLPEPAPKRSARTLTPLGALRSLTDGITAVHPYALDEARKK